MKKDNEYFDNSNYYLIQQKDYDSSNDPDKTFNQLIQELEPKQNKG